MLFREGSSEIGGRRGGEEVFRGYFGGGFLKTVVFGFREGRFMGEGFLGKGF